MSDTNFLLCPTCRMPVRGPNSASVSYGLFGSRREEWTRFDSCGHKMPTPAFVELVRAWSAAEYRAPRVEWQ